MIGLAGYSSDPESVEGKDEKQESENQTAGPRGRRLPFSIVSYEVAEHEIDEAVGQDEDEKQNLSSPVPEPTIGANRVPENTSAQKNQEQVLNGKEDSVHEEEIQTNEKELSSRDEAHKETFTYEDEELQELVGLIPAEPEGEANPTVQRKVAQVLELTKSGYNFTQNLHKKKDFGNPYLLQKVVEFFHIDEVGSNYPKELFDPHSYREEEFVEYLAIVQRRHQEKKAAAAAAAERSWPSAGQAGPTPAAVQQLTVPAAQTITQPPTKRRKWDV